MTLLHLLPEDAIIPLKTAAKSIQMEPGDLLLLLWYRGCEICIDTIGGDIFEIRKYVRRREDGKVGSPEDVWWFNDGAVGELASVGNTLAYTKDLSSQTYFGEPYSVTLPNLSVRAGEVARHCLKPTVTEQGQKALGTKRERTLLKLIGALLAMRYTGPAYENSNGAVNVSRMAESVQQDMAKANINDDGLKERTLRDLIPQAMEAIGENRGK